MNRRILGITLFSVFLFLAISGLTMYLLPFKKQIVTFHTIFGFLLVGIIILHIFNNRRILFQYLISKKSGVSIKIQNIGMILLIIGFAIFALSDSRYVNKVYNIGNEIRNKQLGKTGEDFNYEIIEVGKDIKGQHIEVELKKGSQFGYPLFAIWLEDMSGNYISTLYVSKSMATSVFRQVIRKGKKWVPGMVRRPEALPAWSHSRGILEEDGFYVPLYDSPDLDAVSGATPQTSFIIRSSAALDTISHYKLFVEVNQSFDWNEYYTKKSFPEDSIYSGPGNVGQPALVYSVSISDNNTIDPNYYLMQLEGHSHVSGKNGIIYTNTDSLSTALNIVDRIIVKTNSAK